MIKNILFFSTLFVFVQCEPLVPQSTVKKKQFVFDNHEYEDIVGNVRLFPIINGQSEPLENPIIQLNKNERLTLNFDLLTDTLENLNLKILHCNKEWTQSRLQDVEFLEQPNNFRITEFNYGINTVQPYLNYSVLLPKPFLSGNYLVSVYRRNNPYDILLTRKFLLYSTRTSINERVKISSLIDKREENQQLEFEVNYKDLLVYSPSTDISLTVLQNHNWYTAKRELTPTFIKANEKIIEFHHLDHTTNFSGWNEFRFADLRSLDVSGRNVSRIKKSPSAIEATLTTDRSRGDQLYSQFFSDINGNYVLENNDVGERFVNLDYVDVVFLLDHKQVDGEVYLIGRFNDWRVEARNKMSYDKSNNRYTAKIKLKQGFYEYMYALKKGGGLDPFFEGSHFQTENKYEILVYYRKHGNVYDEIVGYKKFDSR